jgi:hypothetical protein
VLTKTKNMKTLKENTKVVYCTSEGVIYKTIAPINISSIDNYMYSNYSNGIVVLSTRGSVKSGYKKYLNVKQTTR